jgi:hypothetical protein
MTVTSKDVRPDKDAEAVLSGEEAGSAEDSELESIQDLVAKEEKKVRRNRAKSVMEAPTPGRVLLKMERKNASWNTRSGVIFTQEHPFQLVLEDEVLELIKETGFRRADPQEVVYFYNPEA